MCMSSGAHINLPRNWLSHRYQVCQSWYPSVLTIFSGNVFINGPSMQPPCDKSEQHWKHNFSKNSFKIQGFPGGSVVKNLPANAGYVGDAGLIPESGRFPGGGNGNPLMYSCLENAMDGRAWWAVVHGVQRIRCNLVTEHRNEPLTSESESKEITARRQSSLHLRDHEIELWLEKPCQNRIYGSERLGSAEGGS